ncbi:PIG-L family deacetylase [Rhodospirillales bacterium]|nr:PIG-L family deacetylase [Rhodospirillales bacterium]
MSTLVIAPHPDDETLGAGGTLLRKNQAGEDTHWLIITEMREELGFNKKAITRRQDEIKSVSKAFGFTTTTELRLPAAQLDTLPLSILIEGISDAINHISPDTVYVPFPGDVHSDHRVVFNAAAACTKTFRHPCIKRILAMEVASETDYAIDPTSNMFRPNVFTNISDLLDEKIRIMNLYEGEMGEPPFPRSEHTLRSHAQWRGSQANVDSAEAFQLLKEIS